MTRWSPRLHPHVTPFNCPFPKFPPLPDNATNRLISDGARALVTCLEIAKDKLRSVSQCFPRHSLI